MIKLTHQCCRMDSEDDANESIKTIHSEDLLNNHESGDGGQLLKLAQILAKHNQVIIDNAMIKKENKDLEFEQEHLKNIFQKYLRTLNNNESPFEDGGRRR